MEITAILLLITINTYNGIMWGYLDAYKINKNLSQAMAPRGLNHNTRAAIRGVMFFFLSLLAYMVFEERNVLTMVLLFTLSAASFFTPFNLTLNKKRNLPWNYLGNKPRTDRILKTIGGMKTGIFISYLVVIICALILI